MKDIVKSECTNEIAKQLAKKMDESFFKSIAKCFDGINLEQIDFEPAENSPHYGE